ncbi:MAG TPA: cyclic nucleotide-binding domain-containing protein [Ignavibacteriaceae bacterium]|nr:cyclic nucleotide-binding domain-containing protein [Ignavibacteriaceae bacterium]
MPIYKTIQDIKNNKLFTGIKDSVLSSFFDQKEIREAKEGEIIYRTGDQSNALYLVIKGDIRVKFSSNNYVSNRIFNDFFGEKELIDETRRISSAVAFSKLTYYRLDKAVFKNIASKNPAIENNLKKYGELKLPDVSIDLERKFDIVDRKKPISFKAFSSAGNSLKDEKPAAFSAPAVVTQQILPDLESLDDALPEEEIIMEENVQSNDQEQLKKELLEDPSDYKNWQIEESKTPLNTEVAEQKKSIKLSDEIVADSKSEKNKPTIPVETGINREVVRKIFAGIDRIFSSISIGELVINAKRAVKDLINAEGVDMVLIDEKLSSIQKIFGEGDKLKQEQYPLSEGLTGSCALQKKILNFERPTEDSRFNAKIDQPGSARLKRIVYFPVVSDNGETIAVIQFARENKKFTEEDISNLAMMSKQIETAIERTKLLEVLIKEEKQNSGNRLRELITDEIKVPLTIINNYTEILSAKKLPTEADDIIRMLQKQAHSVEDISETLFISLIDELKPGGSNIHFNEFIDDILELLSEYCEARDVKLFKKIGESAIVNIDRAKFYTGIFQLIKASCDDCRKGGKIYFGTEFTEGLITISIQNEGKGSLTEPEGDIQEYYYSGKSFKDDDMKLLLAKKLIHYHSGQLNLESIKGNGSTFRITLPVVQAENKDN